MNHLTNIFSHAFQLHQSGDLQDALDVYKQLLPTHPEDSHLLYLMGTIFSQLDDLSTGIEYLQKSINLNFNNSSAHHNLGNAFLNLNRPNEALASFDQAISLKPNYTDAYFNRGNALQKLERFEEAIISFDCATKHNPSFTSAYINQGAILIHLKRISEAIACLDKAIKIDPEFTNAHFLRGNALLAIKQSNEAIASYDAAIKLNPNLADLHNNRGNALQGLKRHNEAISSYDKSINLKHDLVEAHANRGTALLELRCLEEAISSFDQAIKLNPNLAIAFSNKACALLDLKRLDEAIACFNRAIALQPDYADAYINRGNALFDLKRIDEAAESFNKALSLKPDNPLFNWNLSLLLLLTGNFLKGWELYEWRIKADATKGHHYNFPLTKRPWRGHENVRNKRILIYSEQGLGDAIQFCRYLPFLKELGADVIFETSPSIIPLLSSLQSSITLIPKGSHLPDFDLYCPVMSLPFAFKTTLDSVPDKTPYLYADNLKVTNWRKKLGLKTHPRVGIAWSGSSGHKNDKYRSISLESLLPLLDSPIELHSLQKDYRDDDLELLNQHPNIRQHQNDLLDFSDTAALIECMDLVISVDTSIAHVTGALGKPLWLLLPFVPDYRWLLDRTDSPWYPSAKLFRQQEPYNWQPVIQSLTLHLHEQLQEFESNAKKRNTWLKFPPWRGNSIQLKVRSYVRSIYHSFSQAVSSHARRQLNQESYSHSIFSLAFQLHQSGDLQDALDLYKQLLPTHPEDSHLLYLMGTVFLQLDDLSTGIEYLQKSINLNFNNSSAHHNLGKAFLNIKRPNEALASFDQAITIEPELSDAHYYRGITLLELKNLTEAIASFDKAIALKPELTNDCNRIMTFPR